MNKEETWKFFKKTGSVHAYLRYKDLVKEEYAREIAKDKKEVIPTIK